MGRKKGKAAPKSWQFVTLAACDFFMTAIWAILTSFLGEVADWALDHKPLQPISQQLGSFGVNSCLLVTSLVFMDLLNKRLRWSASFNPTITFSLVCSGRAPVASSILRMAAQLCGALSGSYLCLRYTPAGLQSKFHQLPGGLKPGVGIASGMLCEAGLGFAMNLVFLMSTGVSDQFLVYWGSMGATVAMCWAGMAYTGPSMNPSLAFAWNTFLGVHSRAEHLLVFWAAPFLGAAAAGLLVAVTTRPAKKAKPAKPPKAAATAVTAPSTDRPPRAGKAASQVCDSAAAPALSGSKGMGPGPGAASRDKAPGRIAVVASAASSPNPVTQEKQAGSGGRAKGSGGAGGLGGGGARARTGSARRS
ncbi:aquaporin-like protein [Haematococcus lacustris]